jgi:hypothetical protein
MMKSLKSRSVLTHGRGLTDSVRVLWVSTMHHMANIHAGVTSLLNLDRLSDDLHHKQSNKAHTKRENIDTAKICGWFESLNPFDFIDSRLRTLWSGVADSDDGDKVDSAIEVEIDIRNKLKSASSTDVVMPKTYEITILSKLTKHISAGCKNLNIDVRVLFNRLLIIITRSTDLESYFSYELTPEPTSLFKDGLMRKADKAKLKNELPKGVSNVNPFFLGP